MGAASWMKDASAANPMSGYYAPYTEQQNGSGGVGGYDDPYNLYLSAIPLMQQNMDRSVGGAISSLAPGNRYSSEAFRQAGRIGMEGALGMNDMLSNLMYNQYNQDADRALSASGMMLSATPMVEGAMQNRYGEYSGALKDRAAQKARLMQQKMAAWEQNRANQMSLARMQYSDFEKNKYGTFPMLAGLASNDLGMTPQPILSTSPGKQGYGNDILQLLASYFRGQ